MGFVGIYTVIALMAAATMVLCGQIGGGLLWLTLPVAVRAGYGFFLLRLVRNRRKFWSRPRRAQGRHAVLYAVLGAGTRLSHPPPGAGNFGRRPASTAATSRTTQLMFRSASRVDAAAWGYSSALGSPRSG